MRVSAWCVKLDGAIMVRCTRFAHWFQELTGHTSFFLAKVGVSISMLSAIVTALSYWTHWLPLQMPLAYVIMFSVWVCAHFLRITQCNKAEEHLYEGKVVLPGWVLEERARQTPAKRIMDVALTIALSMSVMRGWWSKRFDPHFLIMLVIPALIFGLVVYKYFINVDPLPPGTNKVREWIGGLSLGPKAIRTEN